MNLRFEPEKWFAGLFQGNGRRKKNALLGLTDLDQVDLATLAYRTWQAKSVIGTGHVGPGTMFRNMVATAKKLRHQQESVRKLCENASPFHSTFLWLLDQEIAYYTDPGFALGLAKPNQDATTATNILLLATRQFVKDRLGRPHYDDLAELFMQIDPDAKDFSADAIRVRARQFVKNHPEMAATAPQWLPPRAEPERKAQLSEQERAEAFGKPHIARASKRVNGKKK